MITFAGNVGEHEGDYYVIWFWDPDTDIKCDFLLGEHFIPKGVNTGDPIWIGTDTKGEIFVKKRELMIPSDISEQIDRLPETLEDDMTDYERTSFERVWGSILAIKRIQKIFYFVSALIKTQLRKE